MTRRAIGNRKRREGGGGNTFRSYLFILRYIVMRDKFCSGREEFVVIANANRRALPKAIKTWEKIWVERESDAILR